MAFIEVSDFSGEFKLPADQFNQAITQSAINTQWESIVRNILGVALGNDVLTYISNNFIPQNDDLDAIINAFQIDSNYGVLESKGLKYAVMGQIYFSRQTGLKMQQNNISGGATPTVENAEYSDRVHPYVVEKVNDSVNTLRAIQQRCLDNMDVYSTFNGVKFLYEYIL